MSDNPEMTVEDIQKEICRQLFFLLEYYPKIPMTEKGFATVKTVYMKALVDSGLEEVISQISIDWLYDLEGRFCTMVLKGPKDILDRIASKKAYPSKEFSSQVDVRIIIEK